MGLEVLVLIAPMVLVGGLLFGYMVTLERRGDAHLIVLLVLGFVVADAFLNGAQKSVPAGLFRPTFGGFDVRLPDLLIPVAVAARLIGSKSYRSLSLRSLVWVAFFSWYFVGMLTGYFSDNPFTELLFQSKVVLWLGGGMIIASGVHLDRLVSSRAYVRGVQIVGVAAGLLLAMKLTGISFAFSLPGLSLPRIGGYTADASTLGVTIGIPMLLLELAREDRRMSVVLPSLMVVMMPIGATQGAAAAGLGLVMLLIVIVSTTPQWRRRVRVRPMEVLAFGLAVVGLALFLGVASGSQAEITQTLEENIEEAFFSSEQANTSALRVDLWRQAWEGVAERPAFAQGVGARVTLQHDWPRISVPAAAHNIYLDIALRLGLIGLFFFLLALVTTTGAVISVWRRHPDDLVATFILGVGIALAGILAKGFAESILEKNRIAVAAGLLVGLVLAAARETDEAKASEDNNRLGASTWDEFSVRATQPP